MSFDHEQQDDFRCVHSVPDPVGTEQHFANVLAVILRHLAPGARRSCGRPCSRTEFLQPSLRSGPIIPADVAGDLAVALDDGGLPARPIAGVVHGDLIRIDYGGSLTGHTPRSWDHVAALWEDRSDPAGPARGAADGRLDGFDLVIHMGHLRLVIEPLAAQAPATVDVLRWRDAGRARRAH